MNLNISWKEDVTYSKAAGLSYSCKARKKGRTDEKDSKLGWMKVRRDGYASKSYQSLCQTGAVVKRETCLSDSWLDILISTIDG